MAKQADYDSLSKQYCFILFLKKNWLIQI
jgi:hypothetical protein